jgi:hypothetical protein
MELGPVNVDEWSDLSADYPSLHLDADAMPPVIRGTFPVRDKGTELDRFRVEIRFTDSPLPDVREVGGRVPWTPDRHVEPDGRACVALADELVHLFPRGISLRQFFDVVLRNYFLGQAIVERGGTWPFGEHAHGAVAIFEFYANELGLDDVSHVGPMLSVLKGKRLNGRKPCFCRSGRLLARCHMATAIRARRDGWRPEGAERALQRLQSLAKALVELETNGGSSVDGSARG